MNGSFNFQRNLIDSSSTLVAEYFISRCRNRGRNFLSKVVPAGKKKEKKKKVPTIAGISRLFVGVRARARESYGIVAARVNGSARQVGENR